MSYDDIEKSIDDMNRTIGKNLKLRNKMEYEQIMKKLQANLNDEVANAKNASDVPGMIYWQLRAQNTAEMLRNWRNQSYSYT
jgi:hypothetical protein